MMTEKNFFDMLDFGTELSIKFTNGYFPTVQELKNLGVDKNPEQHIVLLSFFANDPLKERIATADEKWVEAYKASVKFCNDLLAHIEIK